MCTITFIPSVKSFSGFLVTVNRDEAVNRHAISPKIYHEGGCRLLYPKDEKSGGTWIGVSDRQRLVCLMNGAYKRHQRKPPYRKSRGLVVKDILQAEDFLQTVENYVFEGIEQFTMLIFSWKAGLEIQEVIWDGTEVHIKKESNRPHIWSAPMTYPEEVRKEREAWFEEFLAETSPAELNPEKLWQFHQTAKAENKINGLVINRGELKTTSITQFIRKYTGSEMQFKNLLTLEETRKTLTTFN